MAHRFTIGNVAALTCCPEMKMSSLQAIRYDAGKLEILDQLVLPEIHTYVPVSHVADAWACIREMKVLHL